MAEFCEVSFDSPTSSDLEEEYELEEDSEFRIVVGGNFDVKIKLLNGRAEINGTEMDLNKEYALLPYSSISVLSFEGCFIDVSGNPEAAYMVKNTIMILKVTLHAMLEERRLRAVAENKKGPVIFVVGPNDVDKSSLCRQLLNYAVRMEHQPTFIDLDVGQTSISIPSSVGVLTVKKPADIINGFDNQGVQLYQFGYRNAWENIFLYFLLLQKLGLTLQSDLSQSDQNVKTSGVVISGSDYSENEILDHGYDAITLVTRNFEIDVLIVMQDEDLYLQLKQDMPSNMEIIFFPKEYVEERNQMVKSQSREARICEYFSSSYEFKVKYSDIQVYQCLSKSVSKYTDFLTNISQDDVKLIPIKLSSKLVNQIIGVSCADDATEDFIYMEVLMFIAILKVDMETETLTVLSPQPGPLPKKILLLGDTRLKKSQ